VNFHRFAHVQLFLVTVVLWRLVSHVVIIVYLFVDSEWRCLHSCRITMNMKLTAESDTTYIKITFLWPFVFHTTAARPVIPSVNSRPSLVSGCSLYVLEHFARWHSVCTISFCLPLTSKNISVPTFISWRYSVDPVLRFRGLRNSLGYFRHVKNLTIDNDIILKPWYRDSITCCLTRMTIWSASSLVKLISCCSLLRASLCWRNAVWAADISLGISSLAYAASVLFINSSNCNRNTHA